MKMKIFLIRVCPIEEAMSTDLVHHSGRSAGKLEDLVHRTIRKDIMVGTGISQVAFHVLANPSTIQLR